MASTKLSWRCILTLLCFLAASLPGAFSQAAPKTEFISLEAAQPVVAAFADSLPAELKPATSIDAAKWSAWVQKADREVRERLNKGEEDTLTNLLRFGVTFTKEYRIDDDYLARYGNSSLVDSFAENRANDLIRALSKPDTWTQNSSEGMERMRAFLEKKGFSLKTPEQRKRVKKYLLDNLARLRDDVQRYRTGAADEATRAQLFKDRGISLDTNLWPDYLLDQHFANMVAKGLLKPGSVTKIAIVGPGLDFANKEKGNDFYPEQTIQPFAVVDSLIRLGVATNTIEVYTLDISSEVNFHVAGARKSALAGHAYTVQLPWNTAARHSPEYRQGFVAYWQKLGDQIGDPVAPIQAPDSAPGAATDMQTRAVKIRPNIVRRIQPLDMNIVYQRELIPPQQAFDLIIGTNIFIYYDAFEQSLARANIAAMLKPGGFLLSNDKFPDTVTSGLASALNTTQVIARNPDRADTMFCYRKEK